jgi:hypothetical protein
MCILSRIMCILGPDASEMPSRRNGTIAVGLERRLRGIGDVRLCPGLQPRLSADHASISTTLGIYTHVVDASHRAAVSAVEERLFGVMLRNAPKSAAALETVPPASSSVN